MIIGSARAKEIVSRFKDQRILVVGDLMLDRYIRGSVERISPEAPVPVVRVEQERNMPGGAANVAMNVRSLGGHAVIAGVVGRDHGGAQLREVLKRARIGTDGVMTHPGIRTTIKTRIIAERQQVVRVDWEDALHFSRQQLADFSRRLGKLAGKCTGVILEDYGKGAIRQEVVNAILGATRKKKIPVGFDPNRNHDLRISGVTIVTPNCKEAFGAAGLVESSVVRDPEHSIELRCAADILLEKWKPKQLIITLGSQGMYLISKGLPPRVIPTKAREVFDVSGAGDTVIAACLLAISSGADYYEAAAIGNHAAGVVVGKLGTATCSPAELLSAIREDARGLA